MSCVDNCTANVEGPEASLVLRGLIAHLGVLAGENRGRGYRMQDSPRFC